MDMVPQLRSARFRAEREADWRRLEHLLTLAETRGLRRMDYVEARDLALCYGPAVSALALAREISLDRGLLDYLEALTARAYLSVHAPQEPLGGLFHRFFAVSAPQALRGNALFLGLGFLAMFLGALMGYALFVDNAGWYFVFSSDGMSAGRTPEASTAFLRGRIYDLDPESRGLAALASFLFSHNVGIAILVFGLGGFLCAPALVLTFYNGLGLGAFVALHVQRGLGWDIGGWLSVHGVTEISAICIACGAGVKLGAAVLFPGAFSRREALRRAGPQALTLALVAALMLLVAALLEGFARQLVQDRALRYAIGWGVGGLWLLWAVIGGRGRGR